MKGVVIFLRKIRFLLLLVTFGGILAEIFLPVRHYDLIIFLLTFLWLIVMYVWKLEANFSLLMALFYLVLSQCIQIFVKPKPLANFSFAEKAALWVYIFIFIGVVKSFISLKKQPEDETKLLNFFKIIASFDKDKSLEKIKKISAEEQDALKEWSSVKKSEIRLITKYVLEFLKLKVKTLFRRFTNAINSFFQRNSKLLKNLFLLFLSWSASETKKLLRELFDFSFSPFLNYFKNLISRFKKIKILAPFVHIIKKVPFLEIALLYYIVGGIQKEIKFYKRFYEGLYIEQLLSRLLGKIIIFWFIVAVLATIYYLARPVLNDLILENFSLKNKYVRFFANRLLYFLGLGPLGEEKRRLSLQELNGCQPENKQVFLILVFLVILQGNKLIFFREKDKFEFRSYITRVDYEIASRYSEVIIFGHNFRDMPFRGTVTIEGREQRIKKWGDNSIVVEIDPILSKTGALVVTNDYGFGRGVKSNIFDFTYFDSRMSSQEDEKRFWETLKRKAMKTSFEIDD